MFALAAKLTVLLLLIISIECIRAPEGNLELIGTNIKGLGNVVGHKDKSRWTKKEFYSFTGIKFAKSPTGELRFKRPVPVQPWTGTLDATKPGRLCPQTDVFNGYHMDTDIEDCLHLSVYSPKLDGYKLPVMVYVHGGGWYEGGAKRHPPHYYMEEDIVLVVIQYRLGPLGFLSLETEEIPGNAALLDTILALKWVQEHVHNFGGDAKQVTIAGQSAGAASISLLLQSPLVDESLFHRAIMQSGSSLGSWVLDNNPRENAMQIAKFANCPINGTDKEITRCLQIISPEDLIKACNAYQSNNRNLGLDQLGGDRPTVGGPTGVLEYTPLKALRSGKFRKVPILAGVTEQEGSFIIAGVYNHLVSMSKAGSKTNLNYIDFILRLIGVIDSDLTGSLFGLNQFALFDSKTLLEGSLEALIPGLIDMVGVQALKGPLFRELQIRAKYDPENIYLYSFNYVGEHTRFGYGEDTSHLPFSGGVSHSNDNIYLFPWPETVAQLNDEDAKMSRTMVQLWTSFVKNGTPNSQNTPEWKPMSNMLGPFMKINKVSNLGSNFLEEFAAATNLGRSSANKHFNSIQIILVFAFVILLLK